jgi:hypothetical protein
LVLGAWLVLLLCGGLYLYQVYVLNERLLFAAMRGDAVEVESYLARGASPDSVWEDGRTALDYAKASGNEECVDLLLKAGAHK